MNAFTLTERRPPWVVFTLEADPWVGVETAKLQAQGGRVFRLDGHELREPASLFAAFARELSFPGYFGHNWHALVDCLHDWHGHGSDTRDIAVLIDNADDLHGVSFLGIFVAVLCDAAWRANYQLDSDGIPNEWWSPFTLHFVFLLGETQPDAFAEAVASDPDNRVTVQNGRLTVTLGEDWPTPDID
ncbi:barstar family protein [Catellatospora sp. NPDC049133]|uniref:barstar family protein n=1 Tax=Catellatospora sp. NPDC049133 TaxID=3155499 RepID=UPI0033F5F4D5